MTGAALLTVKLEALDAPALGDGFATVMDSVPADAISVAGMLAVS